MDLPQIAALIQTLDQPPYRARQLYHWIYQRRETDFSRMSSLGRDLRTKLAQVARIDYPKIVNDRVSVDGSRKFLFELEDCARVEAVLIPEPDRLTLCLSSQVGCLVGCRFCATGMMGFKRSLTPGEIVGQLMAVEQLLSPPRSPGGNEREGKIPHSAFHIPQSKITNVVMMGMGEPLLNRRAVFQAARIICDPDGIAIPPRKFSISTVGWVPGIKAMTLALSNCHSGEGRNPGLPRVKLAVSLNATTDADRERLMPLVSKYRLETIIATAREYAKASALPVAFNYLLLAGENDTDADAARLTALLRSSPPAKQGGSKGGSSLLKSAQDKASWCKVNLMEYNEIGGVFTRANSERTARFQNLLRNAGFTVTLRASRGGDVSGACGQLAGEYAPGSGSALEALTTLE